MMNRPDANIYSFLSLYINISRNNNLLRVQWKDGKQNQMTSELKKETKICANIFIQLLNLRNYQIK